MKELQTQDVVPIVDEMRNYRRPTNESVKIPREYNRAYYKRDYYPRYPLPYRSTALLPISPSEPITPTSFRSGATTSVFPISPSTTFTPSHYRSMASSTSTSSAETVTTKKTARK